MKPFRDVTFEDLADLVKTDEKERFCLQQKSASSSNSGEWRVKANQGHSFDLDELDLTRITDARDFPTVIHGTFEGNLASIMESGLSRMSRAYIHFASGLDAKSGIRKSCDTVIHVNLEMCLEHGIEFWVSPNGVILSKGEEGKGILSPRFFSKIEKIIKNSI